MKLVVKISRDIEQSSGKSQAKFLRWVFWDGIFTAISHTNTLLYLRIEVKGSKVMNVKPG